MSQPGIQPGNASEPPTKFGVKGARVLPGEHVDPAGTSPRGPLMLADASLQSVLLFFAVVIVGLVSFTG